MSVPFAFVGIIFIWSTTPLAIKWSGEEIGFLVGVGGRMAIALAVSVVVLALIRKQLPLDKVSWRIYISVAFPMFAAMTFCYWGAQYVSSGLISVIFGLTPIFTGVFAAYWLSEKSFTPLKLMGMAMGFLGLLIIFQENAGGAEIGLIGIGALVAATISHSIGTVWFKRVGSNMPAFSANTGGLMIVVPLYLLIWVFFGEPLPPLPSAYVVNSIVYLGVFGSVIGAFLFYYALKKVKATTIGLLPLITPVSALLIGKWFNDELISNQTLLGTAVILSGLLIYQLADVYFTNLIKQSYKLILAKVNP